MNTINVKITNPAITYDFAATRKNCVKGFPCGYACISRLRQCRKILEGQYRTAADWVAAQAARRSVAAQVPRGYGDFGTIIERGRVWTKRLENTQTPEQLFAEMENLERQLISTGLTDAEVSAIYEKIKITKTVNADAREGLRRAIQMSRGGIDGSEAGLERVQARSKRAYAKKDQKLIDVGQPRRDMTMQAVAMHEYAHHLEYSSNNARAAAKQWLVNRATGQAQPLRKLTGRNYGIDEVALPDSFIDPYVGRVYRSGSTEVFSVGFQYFSDIRSMVKLWQGDRDHFNLVVGLLRSGSPPEVQS
jgi:hypothetical protein